MPIIEDADNKFYEYAMELFYKAGHVTTQNPEFINHSSERFAYFDNSSDASYTREQRTLLRAIKNVSRLFSAKGCVFFSANLVTTKKNRSNIAHDFHRMIHPIVQAKGTIFLFRFEDEIMFSFEGFGMKVVLSEWYSINNSEEILIEKLDIANISTNRGTDYFLDMVYMLARAYYLCTQPTVFELLPINYISRLDIDGDSREEIDQYVRDQMSAVWREYGDDYVDYDETLWPQEVDNISEELDLMLLEMDEDEEEDEDDNPFGEELELEEDDEDEEAFYDAEPDKYEFENVDPEIFRDSTLMVKWLSKLEHNSAP